MWRPASLRCSPQGNNGKVPTSVEVTDLKAESITRLSRDKSTGLGTARSPWPVFAGLETRKPIGWATPKVDFVGRAALERHMRAMLVVPIEKGQEFTPEFSSSLPD